MNLSRSQTLKIAQVKSIHVESESIVEDSLTSQKKENMSRLMLL